MNGLRAGMSAPPWASPERPQLCRFSDAGDDEALDALGPAGVGKAPRHELAGSGGTVGAAGSMGI